jgi:hypothetical protein
MDILKMLAEPRQELAAIDEAILALHRLAAGRGRRRGRKPDWMKAAIAPKRRGRPPGSRTNLSPRFRETGDKASK